MKYLIKAKNLDEFSYLQDPNNRNVPCNVVVCEKSESFAIKQNWHKNLKLEYQILNPQEAQDEGGYRFWAVKVKIVRKNPIINATNLQFQESSDAAYVNDCCIAIETNSFNSVAARLTHEEPRYRITNKTIKEKIRHTIIPTVIRYDISSFKRNSFLGIHQIKDPIIGKEYILYISFPGRILRYFFKTSYHLNGFTFNYLNIRPVLLFNFKDMDFSTSVDRIPAEKYTNLFEDKTNATIQGYNNLSYFLAESDLTTTTTIAPTTTTTTETVTTTTEEPYITVNPITRTPKPPVTLTTTTVDPEGNSTYTYNYTIYYNGEQYSCEHYTVFCNSTGHYLSGISGVKFGTRGSITSETDYSGYYLQVFTNNNALTGKAYLAAFVGTLTIDVVVHLSANDGQIPYPTSTSNEDGTNSIDGVLEDYETT